MTTSNPSAILEELAAVNARLTELTSEMAGVVRATLAIQFTRIAELQAELDLMPTARQHRGQAMRAPVTALSPEPNGNGSQR